PSRCPGAPRPPPPASPGTRPPACGPPRITRHRPAAAPATLTTPADSAVLTAPTALTTPATGPPPPGHPLPRRGPDLLGPPAHPVNRRSLPGPPPGRAGTRAGRWCRRGTAARGWPGVRGWRRRGRASGPPPGGGGGWRAARPGP